LAALVRRTREYPLVGERAGVSEGRVWDIRRDPSNNSPSTRLVRRVQQPHTGRSGVLSARPGRPRRLLITARYQAPVRTARLRDPGRPASDKSMSEDTAPRPRSASSQKRPTSRHPHGRCSVADFARRPGCSNCRVDPRLPAREPGAPPTRPSRARLKRPTLWRCGGAALTSAIDAVLARRSPQCPLSIAVLAAQAARAHGSERHWARPMPRGRAVRPLENARASR
jgi:hypothetical protein